MDVGSWEGLDVAFGTGSGCWPVIDDEVFLEVPGEQEIRPLPVPENVQVHWLPRTGDSDRPGRPRSAP